MKGDVPISSGPDALTADEMLALERVDDNHFRSWRNQDNRAGAIFGGQPLAQALAAAQATVPGSPAPWPAHSLSGNFMRSGDYHKPIDYTVERMRDGRRFATRRVLASQDGKAIFDCLCSFHDAEEGVEHQVGGIEGLPGPEGLENMWEFAANHRDKLPEIMWRSFNLPFPVELRMINPRGIYEQGVEVCRDFWFRMPSAETRTHPGDHHCMIAFASDYWLAGAIAIPHPPSDKQGIGLASLNHAMWFHAPARADHWLLYRTESTWASQGRGLARGQIYDRTGRLVATTMQEASLRKMAWPPPGFPKAE